MGIHKFFMSLNDLERIIRCPGRFKFEEHNVAAHSWKVSQYALIFATIEEKNDAYEQIQHLNSNKASEEKLESIINDTYSVKSFVQIKDTTIKVVIANKDDSYELANNIINTVNNELDGTYYVTVKFE